MKKMNDHITNTQINFIWYHEFLAQLKELGFMTHNEYDHAFNARPHKNLYIYWYRSGIWVDLSECEDFFRFMDEETAYLCFQDKDLQELHDILILSVDRSI